MNDQTNNEPVQMKRCSKCGLEYAATTEYFGLRKDRNNSFRSQCRECDRTRARKRYQDNAEQICEYQRNYVRENAEAIRLRKKVWDAQNVDQRRIYRRAYYELHIGIIKQKNRIYVRSNREHVNAKNRDWKRHHREAGREYTRNWKKANPNKCRVQAQRRAALKRNLPDTLTNAQWFICLEYFNYCCAYCESQRDFWNTIQMEHFIPLNASMCPGTVATNIIPACLTCNSSKQDSLAGQWLTEQYGTYKAKQIIERIEAYFEHVRSMSDG
jgi:hypothetical protein